MPKTSNTPTTEELDNLMDSMNLNSEQRLKLEKIFSRFYESLNIAFEDYIDAFRELVELQWYMSPEHRRN